MAGYLITTMAVLLSGRTMLMVAEGMLVIMTVLVAMAMLMIVRVIGDLRSLNQQLGEIGGKRDRQRGGSASQADT
ncbi:hypothetical protein ACVIJ6_007820 [Bradyrhizobium sp. USDA 4369]